VVHAAADGMAALEIAQDLTVPLDIIVTDVVLPGLDGWSLAKHVTALRPGIGALFISGFSDHPIVLEGLQRREIDFLAKPFSSSDLLGAVRRVLDAGGGEATVPADPPT
jgi:two-component system cell cycle sensor histidine kinase/response regulator CckA